MRKTKIICTIGPASEDPAVFRQMCENGLNVARLNFSHGTHEQHRKIIDMIKIVRDQLNYPIAIMLDTKGPEYRIGTFADGKITLQDGDDFVLRRVRQKAISKSFPSVIPASRKILMSATGSLSTTDLSHLKYCVWMVRRSIAGFCAAVF